MRILVVEDRDDERDLLMRVLGEYELVAASDYDEGLRMAALIVNCGRSLQP